MSHRPKWRALIAHDSELLSKEGTRRIEDHLSGCSICRKALAEIQAYESVATEVRESSVDVDFDRMELALRREGRSIARAASVKRWAPVLLVAAAAGVLAIMQPWAAPVPEVAVQEDPIEDPPDATPEPEPVAVEGVVVALSGEVDSGNEAVDLGATVAEGDILSVGEGTLHVLLSEGSGFALAANSRVRASRLQENNVVLELENGRVSSDVRTGHVYFVDAPPYRIRVQGTRFEVRRDGDRVAVTLDEGIVEVLEGETLVRHMEAPDRWTSHEGFEGVLQGEVPSPRLVAGAALQLPDDPRIVAWTIDGLDFVGGSAGLMAPPGDYDVLGVDASGRRFEHRFTLAPEGGTLDGADLRGVRRAPRGGHLAPEVIAEVVRPSYRALQRCYERELRQNNPELHGDYALRVSVARDGAVESVRVRTESDLPPPLRNCLVRTATAWSFPAPRGGALTFDLPLNFSARSR